MIEMLAKSSLCRQLESATSYDMHAAGDRIL